MVRSISSNTQVSKPGFGKHEIKNFVVIEKYKKVTLSHTIGSLHKHFLIRRNTASQLPVKYGDVLHPVFTRAADNKHH